MKSLKNSKGFTLTELIIVILIIGVLAAVVIPTTIGYIEKAKVSNDIHEVKIMNDYIRLETADYSTNVPQNIPALKALLENAGYSGDYTTESKNSYFWYDTENHKIFLKKMNEMLPEPEESGFWFFNAVHVSAETTTSYKVNKSLSIPESIFVNENNKAIALLGGNKGDKLVEAITTIRNLADNEKENEIETIIDSILLPAEFDADIKKHLKILVDNTLFVGSTKTVLKNSENIVRNIIFSENEINLNSLPDHDYSELQTIVIPKNVQSVSEEVIQVIADKAPNLKIVIENEELEIDLKEIPNVEKIIGNDGSCYDDGKIPVEEITISGNRELSYQETTKLTAVVTPSDATDKTVKWKSSDTNIATVDENGNVEGCGIGTVTIIATSGYARKEYEITVNPVVEIPDEIVFGYSEEKSFNIIVKPSVNYDCTYDFDDSNIEINRSGNSFTVTGLELGKPTSVTINFNIQGKIISKNINLEVRLKDEVDFHDYIKAQVDDPINENLDGAAQLVFREEDPSYVDIQIMKDQIDGAFAIVGAVQSLIQALQDGYVLNAEVFPQGYEDDEEAPFEEIDIENIDPTNFDDLLPIAAAVINSVFYGIEIKDANFNDQMEVIWFLLNNMGELCHTDEEPRNSVTVRGNLEGFTIEYHFTFINKIPQDND